MKTRNNMGWEPIYMEQYIVEKKGRK